MDGHKTGSPKAPICFSCFAGRAASLEGAGMLTAGRGTLRLHATHTAKNSTGITKSATLNTEKGTTAESKMNLYAFFVQTGRIHLQVVPVALGKITLCRHSKAPISLIHR